MNDDGIMITDDINKKSIVNIIDQLNSVINTRAVYLLSKNPVGLLKKIRTFYTTIDAAGGVVLNKNNDVLMIFRKGKWDLPKGKVETGESKRRAAIREVKEETGIKKLSVIQALKLYPSKQSCTFHTYTQDNIAYIKSTYWFLMKTKLDDPLIPQLSEDIVQAEWVSRDKLSDLLQDTYGSINDVIEAAL
jgi:8-oxo-dGTP pyrophosphatase MutT (NUDIX family)